MIHELRKLTAPKEIPDHSRESFGVDQFLWSHGIQPLIKKRHALFDKSLGASQPNATLIGQQLTNGPDTTASQVIDVIKACATDIKLEIDEVVESRQDILVGEGANLVGNCEPKLFIDLVTAHTTEVITGWILKEAF